MNEDLKIRLTGAAFTVLGVALGWWLIVEPYRQALAGAPQVEYSLKAFGLVPAILIFGLACLAFGAKLPLRNAAAPAQKRAGFILAAAILVIAGLTLWWLKMQFTALGYA